MDQVRSSTVTVAPVLLTCDFGLFGLHQLSHHGENVLATLKSDEEELIENRFGRSSSMSPVVFVCSGAATNDYFCCL